ncbi:Uncharacterised protein [Mycobacteroides abscessus subsp. abscessus]|nr:Uncharacterised protein [Mycobacteroides abscessus subsp. abscessus]
MSNCGITPTIVAPAVHSATSETASAARKTRGNCNGRRRTCGWRLWKPLICRPAGSAAAKSRSCTSTHKCNCRWPAAVRRMIAISHGSRSRCSPVVSVSRKTNAIQTSSRGRHLGHTHTGVFVCATPRSRSTS